MFESVYRCSDAQTNGHRLDSHPISSFYELEIQEWSKQQEKPIQEVKYLRDSLLEQKGKILVGRNLSE